MASIFCCEYLEVEDMIFELVGVLVLEAADTAADDTTEKNIKVKFKYFTYKECFIIYFCCFFQMRLTMSIVYLKYITQ